MSPIQRDMRNLAAALADWRVRLLKLRAFKRNGPEHLACILRHDKLWLCDI